MSDLMVSIGASTEALQRALDGASQKLATFADKTKDIGQKMEKMGTQLSLKLTAPLAILGAVSLKAWDKQAKAIAQVEQGLISTGNAVGYTSAELQKMASDLQNTSLFGDEEILTDVTAQLLTFTNIANEQFARTQQAALDLSTRLGGDLKSASIQLGKALNDPVANLSALSRSGIQFSEAQKELINSLVETNRLADAQTIILDELERQYGGSAEAASKAGLGAMKQLSNIIGDLSEEFGKIIGEAILPFVEKLKVLALRFQDLSPNTKKVIVVIGALLAALGPLLATIGFFTTTILPGLSVALGAASTAVGFLTSAFTALNAIIIANPITAIATAFVAAAAAVTSFVQAITPAVSKLRTFFNILISGGNSAVFINKQLQDQAKGMRDLEGDTKGANKELSEYASWLDQTNKFAFSKKPTTPTVKIPTIPTVKERRNEVDKLPTEQIGLTDAFMNIPQKLAMANEGIRMEMRKAADIITEFDVAATEIIGGSIANTFMMLGDAIGRAFAEGGNVLQAATGALLAGLGGLLSAMGDYLIQAGTAAVLAGTVMKLFGTVSGIGAGFAAIAGGVLLKAVGGAFGSFGNKMSDVSTGSTSGSGSHDYSSGGSTVSRSSMSNGDGTVVFEIAGTKLIGVLNRTLSSNRALGGQISING